MTTSIDRAYAGISYTGKRPLNIAPFAESIAGLSDERSAEITALVSAATIPAIQTLFTNGSLTSFELTLYFLKRIQTYDVDNLNSVIELNPDALEIAKACDDARSVGHNHSALHGIPVLLKDNVGTADKMHTTAGAKALENNIAASDAFLVTQLRQAGAVILGKTNLSEWANYMDNDMPNGFSTVGGQTFNPYGRFDVSGSSSGSAASIAAHLAVVSVGSETCGSITAPSSANSIVGLKPSVGMVSRAGMIPLASPFDTAGPMGRTVLDVSLLMNVLAGADPQDAVTVEAHQQLGSTIDFSAGLTADGLRGKRIGVVATPSQETVFGAETWGIVIEALESIGAVVIRDLKTEITEEMTTSLSAEFELALDRAFKEDLDNYLAAQGDHAPVGSLAAIIAFNETDLANHAPYGQRTIVRTNANTMTAGEHAANVTKLKTFFQQQINKLLSEHALDALVTLNNNFALEYAVAGYPALTVPAAYHAICGPAGVTFVGRYLDDANLVQLAYAYEQATLVRRDPVLGKITLDDPTQAASPDSAIQAE